MSFAPNSVGFSSGDGSILGCFFEKEVGNLFEFSRNDDDFAWCADYPHKVWVMENPVNDSGFRYAIVKKTVAYIVVDEDEYGRPVVEKWDIKNHKEYTKA